MRAAVIRSLDGPGAVRVEDVPEPARSLDRVRIAVTAAGVAFPDLLASRGAYQATPEVPFTPGLEVAGTVLAAPAGSGLDIGAPVAAFTLFGGWAEIVEASPHHVIALPAGSDPVQAAAFVVNHFTAHLALVLRAQLSPGESVLIHGAGGGLGLACVQIARAWGAHVVAVVSTPLKADAARRAGARETITVEEFQARSAARSGAFDVVVDPVGGDRFDASIRLLAPSARILVLGFAGGDIPTVRVNRLLLRNAGVLGVAWAEHILLAPHVVAEQWIDLAPRFADGELAPIIDDVLPLEAASDALTRLEERRGVGKLVLRL